MTGELVWLSTPRRGLTYHYPETDGRKTGCGRYIGDPTVDGYPQRGLLISVDEAVTEYRAAECGHCGMPEGRVKPHVRRRGAL